MGKIRRKFAIVGDTVYGKVCIESLDNVATMRVAHKCVGEQTIQPNIFPYTNLFQQFLHDS